MKPMTRKNLHVGFLDHIRGFAILYVFVFHCLGAAYKMDQLPWSGWLRGWGVPGSFLAFLPITWGWAGVPIFFVVSGFCIHLAYTKNERQGFGGFFTRRFFRIYPPYFIALLFFAFLLPSTRLAFDKPADLSQFFSHLFLLENLNYRWLFEINGAFWSVAVEVQLYLLYPALIWIVRRQGWSRTLGFLGALEILMRLAAGYHFTRTGFKPPCWFIHSPVFFWFSWSIGAALAQGYLNDTLPKLPRWSLRVCFLAILATYCVKPLSYLPFLGTCLFTAGLILRMLRKEISWNPLPAFFSNHLRTVGVLSYSVYLIHQPLMHATKDLAQQYLPAAATQPVILMAICLATWLPLLGLSWYFYQWVEMPSISLGKWWMSKRAAPAINSLSTSATALNP
ncbi:MAG: acyltransferase [Verrucomicrobiota bacterium]